MGSPGPFAITAAIPWIDVVDFLPLPLPQPCQLAFVSEENRVENVTDTPNGEAAGFAIVNLKYL